jgi:CMP-N-acetylneuraminic acid synthetase
MKVSAFIFARGGSKGLPSKNIKDFHGKPLISWAIERALALNDINSIIVSTDCEKIAAVAQKYGADIPFIRPKELAEDSSSEWLAWRHALKFVESDTGKMPDAMISIPTTAPLRNTSDLRRCLDLFIEKRPDAVITVTEARRSPYFNMVKKDDNEMVSLAIDMHQRLIRRQDCPKLYDVTTVAYVLNSKFVTENESLFEGRVLAVEVPLERSIDIDTQLDFDIAEFLFKRNQNENH